MLWFVDFGNMLETNIRIRPYLSWLPVSHLNFKQIPVNLLCFDNLGQLGSINFTLFLHLLLLISIILLIVILHLRLPLFNLCVNLIPKAVSHNAFPQIFLEFDGWPAQELVQIAELPEIVERNEIEFGEFD